MPTVRVTYDGGHEDFRTHKAAMSYIESVDLGDYDIDVVTDSTAEKELAHRRALLHEARGY